MTRSRTVLAGLAVAVVIAGVAAALLIDRDDAGDDAGPAPSTTTTTTAPAPTGPRGPAVSIIATPKTAEIAAFTARDGDPAPAIADTWHGRPNALAVVRDGGDWLQVRRPERPNGTTAWVRRTDVDLATTPYRIEINVTTMRLRLFEHGTPVLDAPAGIGTADAPTPVGHYAVAFLQEPQPGGNWGPFVMVTTAHSETISDWEESGDAITAIHGPLGSDAAIGTSGAQVSHGCVRLHLDDLARLRDVPAGSPIDIVAAAR